MHVSSDSCVCTQFCRFFSIGRAEGPVWNFCALREGEIKLLHRTAAERVEVSTSRRGQVNECNRWNSRDHRSARRAAQIVTALDNVLQKTGVPSLIVIDDGQVATEHDQNRGLCPRMSWATDIPPLDSAANVASCDLPVTLTDAGGYKHWSNPKFDDLPWLVDKPMEVSEWVGDVPENAGLLLAKWTGRYKSHRNVDADEVYEVEFQTVAHDPKFAKSVGHGFGETGDKAHHQPDKEIIRIQQ